jgi:ABC-type proline/glycine betaine transport system permease subunit
MAAATAAGLPTGVAAARHPRLEGAALTLASVVLTIPSFALFGLLTIVLGIGNPAVELGLALYALLPIIRNTRTGIGAVDPTVADAARGMGMAPAQVLLRIQLPLALPVIVAGLRQATVMVVAIATVGAAVGANDLGQPLLEGIRADDRDAIFAGALLVGLLAVTADACLAGLERGLSRGRLA